MRTFLYFVALALLILVAVRFGLHNLVFGFFSVLELVAGAVVLFGIFLTIALWMKRRRKTRNGSKYLDLTEELDMREINLMLQRMEQRIESLETILMERETRAGITAARD